MGQHAGELAHDLTDLGHQLARWQQQQGLQAARAGDRGKAQALAARASAKAAVLPEPV